MIIMRHRLNTIRLVRNPTIDREDQKDLVHFPMMRQHRLVATIVSTDQLIQNSIDAMGGNVSLI